MAGGAIKPGPVSAALLLAVLSAVGAAQLAASGVASDPTTTRGDLIVRGADAGLERLGVSGAADGGVLTVAGGVPQWAAAPTSSLPAASGAGELLVSDGAGTAYTATAAATVRASLDATRSISPLDTAGDWTTSAVGVGTGSLVGGVFTAASANGTGGGGNTGGETTRSFPVLTSRWELVCRVGKTGSSNFEWIGLVVVYTGATYTYLRISASGHIAYNTGSGDSASSTFPVDGTGWVSIRYDGGRCIIRYGTGTTTTPPTSWTLMLDSVVLTGRVLPPSALTLTGRTNAGLVLGADSTWYFDHLTVRDLSLGGL